MSAIRQGSSFDNVTLAILAGGEGSRMGMPKARLVIDAKSILEYLLDELAWPGPTMLVTAPGREHPPGSTRFGVEVSDPESGGGPLRGLLTALENLATPMLLVLTVDMPGVRLQQCERLLDGLRLNAAASGVMMRRKIVQRWQIEPFPCAVRADARTAVARRLAENKRSVHGLQDESGFISIDAPGEWGEGVWINLNTPMDFNDFGRKLPDDGVRRLTGGNS